MIFRAIDGSNDWSFGQGLASFFTGNDAIAANVKTRLMFFLNDFFAAMDQGIDWWNLLGSKNPAALNNVLFSTRQTIIQSYGVTAIDSVNAYIDPKTRALTLSYTFRSIFSKQVSDSLSLS